MRQSWTSRAAGAWPVRGRLPQNHRLPSIYRQPIETEEVGSGELARDSRVALVEAALVATDEPLTAKKLATVAGLADAAEARRVVQQLRGLYEREGSAFQVEELAGGFQLLTRPVFHPWLVRLRRGGGEMKISPAARETLAIVAYRQPIARADIEAVRGVQVADVLRQLMEKGLVRIAGRDDSLGRPVLYGTTKKFLQVFGLKSLRDLPSVEGMKRKDTKATKEDREEAE
jgi:segregation and condensation protein B